MPIDPDALMRFRIPSVVQRVTPDAAALYALSIGMGMDPLDTAQLPFVDPMAGPSIMPAMVLVLAHPGFWLSDPQSGVNPAAVLHVAQRFAILGTLSPDMCVVSKTQVTGLWDKGPGRPALIDIRTTLTDQDEAPIAVLDRTVFVRDGGGFGGVAPDMPAIVAPPMPPDRVVDLPTGPAQALLYRLNGDHNPLHSDPQVAHRAGFAGPILHGLATMGVAAHAILRGQAGYVPARLTAMALRFCGPVYPGETISTEIWDDGTFQARVAERDALVLDQGRFALSQPATESTT